MDELYGMQIIFQQSYLKIETKFLSLQKSEAYMVKTHLKALSIISHHRNAQ